MDELAEAVANAMVAAEKAGATSIAFPIITSLLRNGRLPYASADDIYIPMVAGLQRYEQLVQEGEARGSIRKVVIVTQGEANQSTINDVYDILDSSIAKVEER